MSTALHALILAAGRGERMRPFTDTVPKVLAPLLGKPLIVWQIEALARAGFRAITINTAWLGEIIESALGDGHSFGVAISYSREGTALETRGGVVTALPTLGTRPFAVVAGDIHTEFDYGALVKTIERIEQAGRPSGHLILVDNPPYHAAGDMGLGEDGRIVPEASERLTYASIGVFARELFDGLPARERAPLFPWLYRYTTTGQLTGERYRGPWFNVGTQKDLAEATHDREQRQPQAGPGVSR